MLGERGPSSSIGCQAAGDEELDCEAECAQAQEQLISPTTSMAPALEPEDGCPRPKLSQGGCRRSAGGAAQVRRATAGGTAVGAARITGPGGGGEGGGTPSEANAAGHGHAAQDAAAASAAARRAQEDRPGHPVAGRCARGLGPPDGRGSRQRAQQAPLRHGAPAAAPAPAARPGALYDVGRRQGVKIRIGHGSSPWPMLCRKYFCI